MVNLRMTFDLLSLVQVLLYRHTTEYQWPNPMSQDMGMVENREQQKTRYQGVVHVA